MRQAQANKPLSSGQGDEPIDALNAIDLQDPGVDLSPWERRLPLPARANNSCGDQRNLTIGDGGHMTKIDIANREDTTDKPTAEEPNVSTLLIEGAKSPVRRVAASSCGRFLAYGTVDGSIFVHDLMNGSNRRSLSGHTGPIEALSFHPQGNLLISASRDGTFRTWDFWSERCAQIVQAHRFPLRALTISPEGERVATGDTDGTIKIWDSYPARARLILTGSEGAIRGIVFNRQTSVLLSAADDGQLRAWSLATGRSIAELAAHRPPVYAWSVGPDGRRFATAGVDGRARIWDADEIRCVQTIPLSNRAIHAIALSATLLKAVDASGRVILHGVGNGASPRICDQHLPPIRGDATASLAILGGGRVAIGGPDRRVRILSL